MIDMQIEHMDHMEIDERKMSNEQTNRSSSDIFLLQNSKIENYGVPTSIRLPSRS